MSDPIEIKVDNAEILKALKRLSEKTQNLRPVMKNIAGIMMDSVEENFAQQGRPKWKDLAEVTKKQRRKEGKWPGMILQKSQGGLVDSISSDYGDDYAIVGTNKKYAAIHQFGGPAGKKKKVNIPARPYLSLGDDAVKEIKSEIIRYF
ncbi:MAG: phage virion morphogenesis protein [Cyanobacteriota bacterium]